MEFQLAVVQEPPVLLELEASIDRATEQIEALAAEGAKLIVFPETHLPGYPSWVWRLRPGGDMALMKDIHERLVANSVDLEADGLAPIRQAAADGDVTVVCGINELDGRHSRTTLYNTVVTIGADGRLLNRHRKLVPTNPERMVWGRGDGSGLRVVDTPVGRIGSLICWENYMPLARFALYSQGIDLYIAPTWDCGDAWLASLRHIAREAGCWVVGCATAIQARDVPADFPGREQVFPNDDDWLCSGDSAVVSPGGNFVAGPRHRERGVLWAHCDIAEVVAGRRSLDVAGHYHRPDVFRLEVRRSPLPVIAFDDEES
jgi:nitrilase